MNPLEIIEKWLLSLEHETRLNLLVISKHFHPEKKIRDSFEREEAFMSYLKSENMEVKEIAARSLVSIQLINYALEGKDTESYWRSAIDKNLDMRNMIDDDKKEMTKTLDKILSGLPAEKETWMRVCKSWNYLLQNGLTYNEITDWYFGEVQKNGFKN